MPRIGAERVIVSLEEQLKKAKRFAAEAPSEAPSVKMEDLGWPHHRRTSREGQVRSVKANGSKQDIAEPLAAA